MLHYDGSRWTRETGIDTAAFDVIHGDGQAIWATSSGPYKLYRYDGTAWSPTTGWSIAPGLPQTVRSTSASRTWVFVDGTVAEPFVGRFFSHEVAEYSGGAWQNVIGPVTSGDYYFGRAAWGTAGGPIWVTGFHGSVIQVARGGAP